MVTAETKDCQLQRAQFLMQMISAIPTFSGSRAELEPFLDQMDAAYNVVKATILDKDLGASLSYQFLGRIGEDARKEAGIHLKLLWLEAKRRLKERYGGGRHPVHRHVLRVIGLQRRRGESATEYSRRVGDEMRQLKTRVYEGGYTEEEARIRLAAYEELVVESLTKELPDRVQSALRCVKLCSVTQVIEAVWDEEETSGTPVKSEDEGWNVVQRRKPWRPSRRPPQQSAVHQRERATRPNRRYDGARRQGGPATRPQCWTCGVEGHFSRECPKRRQHDREGRRTFAEKARWPEPMDTNSQELRGKTTRPRRRERDGNSSDDGTSDSSYVSRRSGGGGTPRGPGRRSFAAERDLPGAPGRWEWKPTRRTTSAAEETGKSDARGISPAGRRRQD